MTRRILWVVVLTFTCANCLFAQPNSPAPSDALALLQQVGERYVAAKSYRIESIEERTSSNEFERCWNKTILNAAEAPGNRYRFEGQSNLGPLLCVSDGKTEWAYKPGTHSYTQRPTPPDGLGRPKRMMPSQMLVYQAKRLRQSAAEVAKGYKSAAQLPDEVITVAGREVPTWVVRVTTTDLKKPGSEEASFERTIWIAKQGMTIVKEVNHEHTFYTFPGEHIPVNEEVITTYPITDLDLPDLEVALFSFTPPQDAKLVDHFPDPLKHMSPDLLGKPAPAVSLRTPDGKQVSLDSFRGKPVLIDFWATWCTPCVESMPKLARLYELTHDKGLILLSIDKDQDAKDATDFLASKNYAWPNFHSDADTTKAFGEHFGIPRTVLIDAKGTVVFDETSPDDEMLRGAVAKLGPEYAFLAPTSQSGPCAAK